MSGSLHIDTGCVLLSGDGQRIASSVTIRDGYVVAIDESPPADAIRIQLGDLVAMPGLVDSHLHLVEGACGLGSVDLRAASSRGMFEEAMNDGDAALPDGAWLVASGWSEQVLGSTPEKSWLEAAGSRPVVCYRTDLHAAMVNDAVLDLLDPDLVESCAGGFVEEENGRRTGLVGEDVLWKCVIPLIPQPPLARRREMVVAAARQLHARGVTMVGGMESPADVRDVLMPMRASLDLRLRIMLLDAGDESNNWTQFDEDEWLRVIGCKAFIDGTLGSRTARMFEDWSDRPGDRGMFIDRGADGTLDGWAAAVAGSGLVPSMHAIGDEAVHRALNALDGLEDGRIEHAQLIGREDFERLKGRFLCVQPLHRAVDMIGAEEALGDRVQRLHAYRTMLRCGGRLSFGSDWPVAEADPVAGVAEAVNGLREEEALSAADAWMATTGEAAASLQEPRGGRLDVGCFGDVTVFDRNPLDCDWRTGRPIVIMTIVGGEIVYRNAEEDCIS